jgi:hypothetical protein
VFVETVSRAAVCLFTVMVVVAAGHELLFQDTGDQSTEPDLSTGLATEEARWRAQGMVLALLTLGFSSAVVSSPEVAECGSSRSAGSMRIEGLA